MTPAPQAKAAPIEDDPHRTLALELVRATEAAAIASARHFGRGDKNLVDGAAVDAMRPVLATVRMDGVVVIGEGEKDEAPMLYNGEQVGDGGGPEVDIAVDPIDGTTLAAGALPDAVSVVALSERGTMFDPGPCFYMDKIIVPPAAVGAVDPEAPAPEVVRATAAALGRRAGDLTVAVLDRPRHQELMQQVRDTGARVRLLPDGDVAGAILVGSDDTGVDLLLGNGGTPEGVIAAAVMRCLGGEIFGRLTPHDDNERRAAIDAGIDPDRVLTTRDLVSGDDVFFAATGVTDGALLQGVRFGTGFITTSSLSMRSRSGTARLIRTRHDPDRSGLVNLVNRGRTP